MAKRTKTKELLQYTNHLFNSVVLTTDFNCSLSTASIELRLRNVFHYALLQSQKRTTLPSHITFADTLQNAEFPPVVTIHDIPNGHIDYSAYALYTAFRALGRSGPNLFVHVTDPGVGNTEDRTVLVTDLGNTFIGPNNGSLSLMAEFFRERGIPYTLYQIDCDAVEELEQRRMEEPTYHIPPTFHGRDIFAVVAGLIAGGVDINSLCTKLEGNHLLSIPFADTTATLPLKLREKHTFFTFRDNTFGNLKTNLTLDSLSFEQLVDEKAKFQITVNQPKGGFFGSAHKTITLEAKEFYAKAEKGTPLLFLGSTFSPTWDERFIDIGVNMGSAAKLLGLRGKTRAHMLSIERLQ